MCLVNVKRYTIRSINAYRRLIRIDITYVTLYVLLHTVRPIDDSKSHMLVSLCTGEGIAAPEMLIAPKEPLLVIVDDEKKLSNYSN